MSEVLVLSPSFARWSPRPEDLLRAAGVTVRRPGARGLLTSEQVAGEVGRRRDAPARRDPAGRRRPRADLAGDVLASRTAPGVERVVLPGQLEHER